MPETTEHRSITLSEDIHGFTAVCECGGWDISAVKIAVVLGAWHLHCYITQSKAHGMSPLPTPTHLF